MNRFPDGRDPKFKSLADYLIGWSWDTRPFLADLFGISLIMPKNTAGPLKDPFRFIERKGKEELRRDVVNAERFVLSDDFLKRSMERAFTKTPQDALALADLAGRLPFHGKPLLVEFDANVAYNMRLQLGTVPGKLENPIFGRDGFLYVPYADTDDGWNAVHVSDTDGGMPVWPSSCVHAGRVLDISGLLKADPIGVEALASAWGFIDPSTATYLKKMGLAPPSVSMIEAEGAFAFAACKELLERGYARPDPYFMMVAQDMITGLRERGWGDPDALRDAQVRAEQTYISMTGENAGSLRLACAIIAGINHVPTTRMVRRMNSSFQHRLRRLPNLDVTTVDIDAHPGHSRTVYENSFKTAIHHRLHDVRGHWRDFARGDLPFCDHTIVDRDDFYALCGKCQRLLRWVIPHERGDEKLGRVIHDHYRVR